MSRPKRMGFVALERTAFDEQMATATWGTAQPGKGPVLADRGNIEMCYRRTPLSSMHSPHFGARSSPSPGRSATDVLRRHDTDVLPRVDEAMDTEGGDSVSWLMQNWSVMRQRRRSESSTSPPPSQPEPGSLRRCSESSTSPAPSPVPCACGRLSPAPRHVNRLVEPARAEALPSSTAGSSAPTGLGAGTPGTARGAMTARSALRQAPQPASALASRSSQRYSPSPRPSSGSGHSSRRPSKSPSARAPVLQERAASPMMGSRANTSRGEVSSSRRNPAPMPQLGSMLCLGQAAGGRESLAAWHVDGAAAGRGHRYDTCALGLEASLLRLPGSSRSVTPSHRHGSLLAQPANWTPRQASPPPRPMSPLRPSSSPPGPGSVPCLAAGRACDVGAITATPRAAAIGVCTPSTVEPKVVEPRRILTELQDSGRAPPSPSKVGMASSSCEVFFIGTPRCPKDVMSSSLSSLGRSEGDLWCSPSMSVL